MNPWFTALVLLALLALAVAVVLLVDALPQIVRHQRQLRQQRRVRTHDWMTTRTEQDQREILQSVLRASQEPVNVYPIAQHKPLRADFTRLAR